MVEMAKEIYAIVIFIFGSFFFTDASDICIENQARFNGELKTGHPQNGEMGNMKYSFTSKTNEMMLTLKGKDHRYGHFSIIKFCFKVIGSRNVIFKYTSKPPLGIRKRQSIVQGHNKWTRLCVMNKNAKLTQFSAEFKKAKKVYGVYEARIKDIEIITCHYGVLETDVTSRVFKLVSAYNATTAEEHSKILSSIYATDAIAYPANGPTVKGRKDIVELLDSFFNPDVINFVKTNVTEVNILSEKAAFTTHMTETFYVDGFTFVTRTLMLWWKIGEQWFAARHIWNAVANLAFE